MKRSIALILLASALAGCGTNLKTFLADVQERRARYCSAAESNDKARALRRLALELAQQKIPVPENGICGQEFDAAVSTAHALAE